MNETAQECGKLPGPFGCTRVWMGHAILWQQTLYLGAVKHLGALCMGAFEHQITSTAVQ